MLVLSMLLVGTFVPAEEPTTENVHEENSTTLDVWDQIRKEAMEDAIESMKQSAEDMGMSLSDSDLDAIREKWDRETTDPAETARRFHIQNLEKIEDLAPELVGLSTTWEVTAKPEFFNSVITGLGRYHGMSQEKLSTLTGAIEKFENALGDELGSLHAEMDAISKYIPTFLVRVHEDYTYAKESLEDYRELKDEVEEFGLEVNVDFVEKFGSCIASVKSSIDKDVMEELSSFSTTLTRGALSVEKMRNSDQEFSAEISAAISERFTAGFLQNLITLGDLSGFLECEEEIDREQVSKELRDAMTDEMWEEISDE